MTGRVPPRASVQLLTWGAIQRMLPARLYVRGAGEYAIEIVSGALAIEHSVAVLDVAHPAAEGVIIAFLNFGPECAHAAQATPAIPAATAKIYKVGPFMLRRTMSGGGWAYEVGTAEKAALAPPPACGMGPRKSFMASCPAPTNLSNILRAAN